MRTAVSVSVVLLCLVAARPGWGQACPTPSEEDQDKLVSIERFDRDIDIIDYLLDVTATASLNPRRPRQGPTRRDVRATASLYFCSLDDEKQEPAARLFLCLPVMTRSALWRKTVWTIARRSSPGVMETLSHRLSADPHLLYRREAEADDEAVPAPEEPTPGTDDE